MKIPDKKEIHAKVKVWLDKRSGSGFQPHDLTKLFCDIIEEVFAENVVETSTDRRTLERYRGAMQDAVNRLDNIVPTVDPTNDIDPRELFSSVVSRAKGANECLKSALSKED